MASANGCQTSVLTPTLRVNPLQFSTVIYLVLFVGVRFKHPVQGTYLSYLLVRKKGVVALHLPSSADTET